MPLMCNVQSINPLLLRFMFCLHLSAVNHGMYSIVLRKFNSSIDVSFMLFISQQEEICQLRSQVDELIRRRQQTEMALSAVNHCLLIVQSDVQLSPSSLESVKEAKQYIEQCFEGGSACHDIESTMNWVQQQDYQIYHEVGYCPELIVFTQSVLCLFCCTF